jgi:hypothetical protein
MREKIAKTRATDNPKVSLRAFGLANRAKITLLTAYYYASDAGFKNRRFWLEIMDGTGTKHQFQSFIFSWGKN